MALRRNTRSVDGTIPVQALLYNDEEVHASQDGVGIYDGYVDLALEPSYTLSSPKSSSMNDAVCRNRPTTKLVPYSYRHIACST